MNLRKITPLNIATAVAPLILLATAISILSFVWLAYSFYPDSRDLRPQLFYVRSAIGILSFSLGCLGFMLIKPTHDCKWQGLKSVEARVGLNLFALTGLMVFFLFVVPWGYHDWRHSGIWAHFFLASSTIGVLTFSLAFLGFLFVNSTRNRVWHGLRSIASSVVLYASALIGSRYWNGYLKGPEWDALFFLSPLIFFAPAALAFYLGRSKRKQTIPSPAKWHSIPIGQGYLLSYIVSLVIYISAVYIGGKLLLWGTDNDFVQLMDINIVFFFLLPVQAGALLVFSITSGKAGGSWAIVIARLALCVVFALICYSALEHLPARLYGE